MPIQQLAVCSTSRFLQISLPADTSNTGDGGKITVGDQTNIQDGTVIRTGATSLDEHPANTEIGSMVTIGHQASLHACKIEDEALIGMGATLLQGSKVGFR